MFRNKTLEQFEQEEREADTCRGFLRGCSKTITEGLGLGVVGLLLWWVFDAGLLTAEQVRGAPEAFRAALQASNPGVDFAADIAEFNMSLPGLITVGLFFLGAVWVLGASWKGLGMIDNDPELFNTYHGKAKIRQVEQEQYNGVSVMASGFYLRPVLLAYAFSLAHAYWLMSNPFFQATSSLLMLDFVIGGVSTGGYLAKRFYRLAQVAAAAIGIFNLLLTLTIYFGGQP